MVRWYDNTWTPCVRGPEYNHKLIPQWLDPLERATGIPVFPLQEFAELRWVSSRSTTSSTTSRCSPREKAFGAYCAGDRTATRGATRRVCVRRRTIKFQTPILYLGSWFAVLSPSPFFRLRLIASFKVFQSARLFENIPFNWFTYCGSNVGSVFNVVPCMSF